MAGLIHHSDRGSQYTDQVYQALLKDFGIRASMNGVGTWYDNAPMESFFGTLKSEWLHTMCITLATRPRPACSFTLSRSTIAVAVTRL